MKTSILSVIMAAFSLAILCQCTSKDNKSSLGEDPETFVIEGTLPAEKYDSACLYLVPMQGPHPRPVDSVFVGRDGSFRFEGNVEQIAVLRLSMYSRIGVQDLLVCTEPGVTRVVLDSISYCESGTPQNLALQQWKDRVTQYSADNHVWGQMQQAGVSEAQIKRYRDSISISMGNDIYQLLKGMGRNTTSIFINKMRNGTIDSLRVAELNELLRDTVDWTHPQPGFRK